jgi:hypothetical protein
MGAVCRSSSGRQERLKRSTLCKNNSFRCINGVLPWNVRLSSANLAASQRRASIYERQSLFAALDAGLSRIVRKSKLNEVIRYFVGCIPRRWLFSGISRTGRRNFVNEYRGIIRERIFGISDTKEHKAPSVQTRSLSAVGPVRVQRCRV